jgi:serine/threonine protein kinase
MDIKAGSERSKTSDFEIQTKLGQGSFGIVYKVKRKCKDTYYSDNNLSIED